MDLHELKKLTMVLRGARVWNRRRLAGQVLGELHGLSDHEKKIARAAIRSGDIGRSLPRMPP